MKMKIYVELTQEDYDTICFLNRLAYFDLKYPEPFNKVATVSKLDGLRMNVFDMGHYTLVICCGTNDLRDWITNFKVALGIEPHQYWSAYDYVVQEVYLKDREKPIVMSGHSLGGGIAEHVSSTIWCQCITFNGCGCKHLIPYYHRDDFECINVITKHDILNGITRRIPFAKKYMQHNGEIYIVDDKSWFPLSVKSHSDFGSMGNFDFSKTKTKKMG